MTGGHHVYLDRFEGDHAVVVYRGEEIIIPRDMLPDETVEGDHLSVGFVVDPGKRYSVSDEIEELRGHLRGEGEDGP